MERTQFTFYESFYRSLSHMTKASEKVKVYDAICRFALYGEEPELSGSPAAIFEIVKPVLVSSRKKSLNGKKGGSVKQNGSKSSSETMEVANQEKVQVKEQYVKEKKEKFSPPTSKEVEEYVREKGYHIDPEAFVAFYTSKGWKVGNTPMKDWKAAVVTWEKKYKENHPSQPEEKEERPVLDIEEFNARWEQMGG